MGRASTSSSARSVSLQRGEARSPSQSVSNRGESVRQAIRAGYECCGCWVSGNALSLLSAAFLFALITGVQYFYAIIAGSVALQADCVSMGVDSLAFLGNLFAECAPNNENKRALQLGMSGISHFLLLGFTGYFIYDGIQTLNGEDDDVNPWIVFGFACGGLLFDIISLTVYWCCGERNTPDDNEYHSLEEPFADPIYSDAELMPAEDKQEDALTCGINTNMCAALLHVISDLGRSFTTLVESIVIIMVPSIPGNKADAISALIICSMISAGTIGAIIVWGREVYQYCHSNRTTTIAVVA